MTLDKTTTEIWNQLDVGVQFTWSAVDYEVVRYAGKIQEGAVMQPDVCQIRCIGRRGKMHGPVRRFMWAHCVIELPQILKGRTP